MGLGDLGTPLFDKHRIRRCKNYRLDTLVISRQLVIFAMNLYRLVMFEKIRSDRFHDIVAAARLQPKCGVTFLSGASFPDALGLPDPDEVTGSRSVWLSH